jgi:hypothetical protein
MNAAARNQIDDQEPGAKIPEMSRSLQQRVQKVDDQEE